MTPILQSTDAPQWLGVLSAALGINIDWDGTGQCAFEFEGGIEVVVAAVPDCDLVSVRSHVPQLPQPPTSATLLTALQMNYGLLPPGQALALDADSQRLMLVRVLDGSSVTREEFEEVFSGILSVLPQLTGHLVEAMSPPGPRFESQFDIARA